MSLLLGLLLTFVATPLVVVTPLVIIEQTKKGRKKHSKALTRAGSQETDILRAAANEIAQNIRIVPNGTDERAEKLTPLQPTQFFTPEMMDTIFAEERATARVQSDFTTATEKLLTRCNELAPEVADNTEVTHNLTSLTNVIKNNLESLPEAFTPEVLPEDREEYLHEYTRTLQAAEQALETLWSTYREAHKTKFTKNLRIDTNFLEDKFSPENLATETGH